MKRSPERGDVAPRLQRRFPNRPPRLELLFWSVRSFYFVTFNTHRRVSVLARDEIHNAFQSFCVRAEVHNIAVGRYVIMPDHVHLFVAFPETGLTLSEWIGGLKTVLGKHLLRLGIQKPHWQEGFFDHVLRSAESYEQKWEYVRLNPVRAGLCDDPDQWRYQGEVVSISFD
jgi:REP element-mobilizing transposase RayT